jgi:hypothetical protein
MKNPIRIVCVALVVFTIVVSHHQWAPQLERLLGLNKKKPVEVVEEKPDPKALVSIGGGEDFVDINKLQADEEGGTFSRAIPPTPEPQVETKPKARPILNTLLGIPSPQEVQQNFAEVGKQLGPKSSKQKVKYIYTGTTQTRYLPARNKGLENRYGNRKPMSSTLKEYPTPSRVKKYPTPIPSRYGLREPMESTLKKKRRRIRRY